MNFEKNNPKQADCEDQCLYIIRISIFKIDLNFNVSIYKYNCSLFALNHFVSLRP